MYAQRSCEGYIGFNVFEWSVSPVCSTLFRCADYQDIPITLFFGEFSEI